METTEVPIYLIYFLFIQMEERYLKGRNESLQWEPEVEKLVDSVKPRT